MAFSQLVAAHQDRVFNTALGIMQDQEESEDIAQEVFISVFQSIGKFRSECRLSTWLYRITLAKALDRKRKLARKKRFAVVTRLFNGNEQEQGPVDFVHPGVLAENKERSVILFKAMDALPPNQKSAFVLCKVEGLSYVEIADIMDVSVGAVESYLHRAKQNLRKSLDHYYYHS